MGVPPPGVDGVAARGITLGRDLIGQQPMAVARDADEPIPEQRLHARLRPGLSGNAQLEVDEPLAQRPRVLVRLGRETRPRALRPFRRGAAILKVRERPFIGLAGARENASAFPGGAPKDRTRV
jgi:hypothetical protein